MEQEDYENQGYTFTSNDLFRDKVYTSTSQEGFKFADPGWCPDFTYCRGYGGNGQFFSSARLNGRDSRQMKQGSTTWETEGDQENFKDWRYGSTGKSMTTSSAAPSQSGYYTATRQTYLSLQ